MTAVEWIICERSCRWAPALRTMLERHGPSSNRHFLSEVRSLPELTSRIDQRPNGTVLIEVNLRNFDEALAWIAEATRGRRCSCIVALLDAASMCSRSETEDAASAVREAGAADVVLSPRDLQRILPLGSRRVARSGEIEPRNSRASASSFEHTDPAACQSIADWARALLPWQDADRPIG